VAVYVNYRFAITRSIKVLIQCQILSSIDLFVSQVTLFSLILYLIFCLICLALVGE